MNITDILHSLLGGVLIGLSASFLLVTLGRVAGVSGIVGTLLARVDRDSGWRLGFILGMVAIGAALLPHRLLTASPANPWLLATAGLLVGFGTRLGNGCTSGHGVCGISRLSVRSIVATGTFIITAAAVVFITRHWVDGGTR